MSEKQIRENETKQDQPPQPPELKPRFQMERTQWLAIPVILLIPVAALFGAFDNASRQARMSGDGIEVQVDYPSRVRYKNSDTIHVALRNISDRPIPDITVGVDRKYIEVFAEASFTPSVDGVTEREFQVRIDTLEPGEERSIRVDGKPVEYWGHDGSVRVTAPERLPVEVPLRTFVIP